MSSRGEVLGRKTNNEEVKKGENNEVVPSEEAYHHRDFSWKNKEGETEKGGGGNR